jgi:large subunit ribosomal protein L10
MRREEKVDNVGVLREEFSRAKVAVVADYRGLTAGQFDSFRNAVRAVDGRCRVAKNRLAKRAIEGTAYVHLESLLRGPTALILGFDDPVAVAKTAVKFAGDIEALEIRGAVLDGAALPPAEVKALADLPPREVLQAQLLAVMLAPATQLVRLLSEPASQVARLVKAIADRGGEQ